MKSILNRTLFVLLAIIIVLSTSLTEAREEQTYFAFIDSYSKAQQFSGFLSRNKGNAVYFQISVTQLFWEEESCTFTLKLTDPDSGSSESFVSYGIEEQYCIEDCRGGYDLDHSGGIFDYRIEGSNILFSGTFVPLGDLGHSHQGEHSVGLRPLQNRAGELEGTDYECH